MSQDELLRHVDRKLAPYERPMKMLWALVFGGFFIGAWATAQQMTISGLVEWKQQKIAHDREQDMEIRALERDVLSKLHGVSTRIGQSTKTLVQEIQKPGPQAPTD